MSASASFDQTSRSFESEMQSGGEWLNAAEAAEYLRLFTRGGKPSVATLRNLVWQNKIPFYKPWGRLLFRRSELQKIIETSRRGIGYVNNNIRR